MPKIKNITKYLIEIQTLNISNNLEYYSQKSGEHLAKINTMQQKALFELRLLSPKQLAGQQKEFERISGKFKRFWDWYAAKYDEPCEDNEFWFFLRDYFIIKGEHKGSVFRKLFQNLDDAFMCKISSLEALMHHIKPDEVKEETIQDWEKYLEYLKGFNQSGEKIMPDNEYKRLIDLVSQMIGTGELPKDNKQFSLNGVNQYKIKYSFYKIHVYLYGHEIRDVFIDFLKTYFLKNWKESTIKTKFSVKPGK